MPNSGSGKPWHGREKMSSRWIPLESEMQLEEAVKASYNKPVVLFKHSTRCGISSMALNRLELADAEICKDVECYFLDLLQFRNVSNLIADKLHVYHQSPQVLLLKNGECIFEASHGEIYPEELSEQISAVA